MKLKRFTAKDARTAMRQIKEAFGPDAVILSSHEVAGGIEIVAAIDFDESILNERQPEEIIRAHGRGDTLEHGNEALPSLQQKPVARDRKEERNEPVSAFKSPSAPPTSLDDMRQEILTLRSMLETQFKTVADGRDALHKVLAQRLEGLGCNEALANTLVQGINPALNQQQAWDLALNQFKSSVPLLETGRIEEGGAYAFVGPTGVGKTTTLAKIAARFTLRYGADQLGLITLDTYRIAAQEQLLMYGKILGCNVYVANDQESMKRVMSQLADKKLILIDTAGMNPDDERLSSHMQLLHDHERTISPVLVIPATSHYQVLRQAIKRYHPFETQQCIITKVDESFCLASALSAIIEVGLPVSYLTNGQRVPEDIKLATPHQLLELLMIQDQKLSAPIQAKAESNKEVRRNFYVEG